MGRPKTLAEMDEEATRMVQVEERLLAGCGGNEFKIEGQLAAEWAVSRRTVRRLIDRTKARWAAEAAKPVDRAARRATVLKALEDLAYEARTEGKLQVQAHALRMICDLEGLDAPKRIETTGAAGGPQVVEHRLTLEDTYELAKDER